jgi:hypothetical protein
MRQGRKVWIMPIRIREYYRDFKISGFKISKFRRMILKPEILK